MARIDPADPSGPPAAPQPTPSGGRRSSIRFSGWNLLLLLPLLMLITVWFNKDRPRLFGWPFFYWYQMLFVLVGVACVAIVYTATRHHGPPKGLAEGDPDGRLSSEALPPSPADLGDRGELQ